MNLRKQINEDLIQSMENLDEWGLPVHLVSPDGIKYSTKKDTTEQLSGQVLYNKVSFNPETGEEVVIDDPIVILRLNSLERVPAQGEYWTVRVPESPDPDAPLIDFAQTPTKAMRFNRSFGFVIMYLQKLVQSV